MATVEEVNLARDIRRLFAKRPIDSGRLEIQCIRGRVYLSGIITAQKEEVGVVVKSEVQGLIDVISKMSGVKQLFNECKMVEPEKKEKKEHEGPTGH